MSSSTARRTAVLAVGSLSASALGMVLVAGPAAAAPVATQVPLPLPSESPLDVLVEAIEPVVEQLPEPVQGPVQQVIGTVQGAAPAVPVPTTPPATPAPGAAPQPQAQPAAKQPPAAQPAAAAPAGQISAPLFSDARTVRALSTGRGTAVLDAFSAAIGMGSVGGFGSASGLQFDAMAPQIASPFATLPGVEAPEVAPPQQIELAAGLGDAAPLPGALPGMTVAAAALAIATAAAGHLAHAARRRDIFA